jgi:uncharacterized protein (TIGR03435 family)
MSSKLPGHAERAELLLMLRGLLTERFQFAVHREKKAVAVYALTFAKSVPRFHVVTPGCCGGVGNRFLPVAVL